MIVELLVLGGIAAASFWRPAAKVTVVKKAIDRLTSIPDEVKVPLGDGTTIAFSPHDFLTDDGQMIDWLAGEVELEGETVQVVFTRSEIEQLQCVGLIDAMLEQGGSIPPAAIETLLKAVRARREEIARSSKRRWRAV